MKTIRCYLFAVIACSTMLGSGCATSDHRQPAEDLLFEPPASWDNGTIAKIGEPIIVKVFEMPVGIEANGGPNHYLIQYGILPNNVVRIQAGETLRIKIVGDEDILVSCKGGFYSIIREKTSRATIKPIRHTPIK